MISSTRLLRKWLSISIPIVTLFSFSAAEAAVEFEKQYKVSDIGLYFNGVQTKGNSPNKNNPNVIDYAFGKSISAHGDAIKVYKEFIFTTWYKGGKNERNLMLSRYNTKTGVVKTIEFPHKHTGYNDQWWIGESHNTAAVGISPKDGKIHILYDMHSYSNSQFNNDYFRYSYTKENAATVPDSSFTLSLFVADGTNDYGHNNLNGKNDPAQFSDLTYPTFFLNENNDLLFFMRTGGNNNGGYVFTSYDSTSGKWADITQFNHVNSSQKPGGPDYNWGLYGEMKYVNGKLRTAFQVRSANNNDKFLYQNGIYYAYSDDQSGKTQWKTHTGKSFTIPFANPQPLKIYEPGDLVKTEKPNKVYIVGAFDFTVTDKGDVHIVSLVKDNEFNVTKKLHSYKPAGASDFIHTTDFTGGSNLYTYGDSVYIIGLKSGRPFIQQGKGGTNNFTTIYEDTQGPQFDHGVLTIHEGKVYYYLQDKGNSTKLPLHVQIIDLGLKRDSQGPAGYSLAANENETVTVSEAMNIAYGANGLFNFLYEQTENVVCNNAVFGDPIPRTAKKCYAQSVAVTAPILTIAISAPSNNSEVILGQQIALAANATSNKNNIAQVNFRINGQYLSQDSSAPYSAQWSPERAGTYTIDSVLITSDGTRLISDARRVNVVAPQLSVSLTAPNNSQIQLNQSIALTANVTSNLARINKIVFRVNGQFLKQDSDAPYSVEWIATQAGSYTLDALLMTEDGSEVTSEVISVSVKPAASSKPVSSATNSSTSPAKQCATYINLPFNARTEVALTNNTCLRFPQSLSGKTLQLWDSDENDCDFRGEVTATAGSGSITVSENYASNNSLTGTDIKFINAAGNTCKFIKARAY